MFLFKRKNENENEKPKNLTMDEVRDLFKARQKEYEQEDRLIFEQNIQLIYEMIIKKILNGEFLVPRNGGEWLFVCFERKQFENFDKLHGKDFKDSLDKLFNPHGLRMDVDEMSIKNGDYCVRLCFTKPIYTYNDFIKTDKS